MFGFLIKKWFFDLWDNFLPSILVNLGFVLVLTVPVLVTPAASAVNVGLGLVALAAGVLVVAAFVGGAFSAASTVADYRSVTFRVFWDGLVAVLPTSLLVGTIFILHAGLFSVALPFYASFDSWLGLFAVAVLFWISVAWILTAQFVLSVRLRLAKRNVDVLKKAFIFFFDNLFFSIAVAIGALVIIALSVLTAFLLPGITGLAIWYESAMKLRLYKYDYLEEHPDERGSIPWDALIYDDRERVGKRTLRGMIFPWKE